MAQKMGMVGMILIAFIVLILGINFLTAYADAQHDVINTGTVTNESFTGINATAVALTYDNMIAVSEVRNASNDALTITDDYTVNLTTGSITVLVGNGTYYADYTYYPDTYVQNSASRSIIGIILVLFAIGILGLLLALVLPELRDLLGF